MVCKGLECLFVSPQHALRGMERAVPVTCQCWGIHCVLLVVSVSEKWYNFPSCKCVKPLDWRQAVLSVASFIFWLYLFWDFCSAETKKWTACPQKQDSYSHNTILKVLKNRRGTPVPVGTLGVKAVQQGLFSIRATCCWKAPCSAS